jgi:fructose/tagatose bisphosphate aldolase
MMVDAGWLESRGVAMLGSAARVAAERASVPAALMFNEAQSGAQISAALEAGYNCVLLSTEDATPDEALRITAELVAKAHAVGASVEAELGHLPDATDLTVHGDMTDPDEAAHFVSATGVDCLAVSIGNVHIKTDGWATIDTRRLEALRAATNVPFALHGGTSFPPSAMPHAIANGIAKINVGTALKKVYWEALAQSIASMPPTGAPIHDLLGSRKASDYTAAARAALTAKVRELMRLYGSSAKATCV